MKNNINFKWLYCPNCNSTDLIQTELREKDTGEVIERILYCQNCDYYCEEKFIKINWAMEIKEYNKYLPKA